MSPVRMNWQIKTLLPVALVLLNGLLLFVLVTLTLQDPLRNRVLAVAVAGAVAICAVLFVVLAVMVHRPILELQRKIAQVRAGDLFVNVDFAERNDEIGDLGRHFNGMVQQLRESREEIQRLHRTQMSRAEHLATLGEMAAGLAHEIRNPLAGIAGVMEIVGRDLPAKSAAIAVLGEARHEVVHINKIVSELLEIARPKAPEFRLGDLVVVAQHASLFARDQASAKHVTLEIVKNDQVPMLEFDAGQIHQVLLNLLLNAVQACGEGGNVRVDFSSDEKVVTVRVVDTGQGISPEVLPNIFRPFFTTKGNGTGLGLSLVRRIVEDHGGTIEAASELGKGSEFTLALPRIKTTE
ncbi:MAG TPA: ATP-binding protein [Candidatus Saccharimonadales bacterium]|nr:ATP-binding protein [Candidatus Saccharimonadales bacterium]